MVFMIIIPMKNCYFIGNINPTFSDKPILLLNMGHKGGEDSYISCLIISGIYGRYNEPVFIGVIVVYKPTNITGGAPSCGNSGFTP